MKDKVIGSNPITGTLVMTDGMRPVPRKRNSGWLGL